MAAIVVYKVLRVNQRTVNYASSEMSVVTRLQSGSEMGVRDFMFTLTSWYTRHRW